MSDEGYQKLSHPLHMIYLKQYIPLEKKGAFRLPKVSAVIHTL